MLIPDEQLEHVEDAAHADAAEMAEKVAAMEDLLADHHENVVELEEGLTRARFEVTRAHREAEEALATHATMAMRITELEEGHEADAERTTEHKTRLSIAEADAAAALQKAEQAQEQRDQL